MIAGPAYLAVHHLLARKGRTLLLIACITIPLYLPVGLEVIVARMGEELGARARATPLLIGAKGSPLDLTLGALYFETNPPALTTMAQVARVERSGWASAIPLHLGFEAGGRRIVGTTLDYFEFRGLRVERGRMLGLLGECLLGAEAAATLKLAPGQTIVSSPGSLFDLAGTYPLRLRVAGVLARSHTPDDRAIFVDLRTTWIIAGVAHGHGDLQPDEILSAGEKGAVANASVVQHAEVTEQNVASFHFHGADESLPVHALLVRPRDEKSQTLLKGRYLERDDPCQILVPEQVMAELLATVAKAERLIATGFLLLGAAALLATGLVFLLTFRMRRRELETMRKMGCARTTVATLIFCEVGIVVAASALVAFALVAATSQLAPQLLRTLLL